MTEDMKFENKFTTVSNDNLLQFPQFGDIVNDGENDLVVCDVEKIDGKDYVLFFDKTTTKIALYEVIQTETQFNYNLVNDDVLLGKVIMNIINKSKGEK